LGSVEFVERHASVLATQAVAYFNVDFGVKGREKFSAKGTPNLQQFLKEIVELVPLPDERDSTRQEVVKPEGAMEKKENKRVVAQIWEEQKLLPLGATSDYMPFLQV
jgi:hypothetical protein